MPHRATIHTHSCKIDASPEPRPDVSLGKMIRAYVRNNKEWYQTIEARFEASNAQRQNGQNGGDVGASRRHAVLTEGETRSSHFRCESCSRCFVSVDKLDRHRLLCLDANACKNVVVRSDKSFSGYEGVVQSQVGGYYNKFEVYYVSASGYRGRLPASAHRRIL